MEEKLLFKPCPFCGGLYMGAYAVKEDSTRCSALIKCANYWDEEDLKKYREEFGHE